MTYETTWATMDEPDDVFALGLASVLCCLLQQEAEAEEDKRNERNRKRKERWASLTDGERNERTRSMPRSSLLLPVHSPWNATYRSRSDRALITLTGLNFAAFDKLLNEFSAYFNSYTPYGKGGTIRLLRPTERRGRRRIVTNHACLGLVLMWCRTTCPYWVLSATFGIVGSTCSDWLRFGKRILVHVLASRQDSIVKLPDPTKLQQCMAAIEAKHPALKNVAYTGDGLKILLQKAGDEQTQEAFYNGWKSGHYISNVFVFAPDGTIVMAMVNCPGSMHDSELASKGSPSIYDKIDMMYEQHGAVCVMDSAFATSNKPSIIKSKKRETITTTAQTPEEYEVLVQAVSMRQSSEWGMRALQGAFGRLKAVWPYEERDERLWGLIVICMMYNYAANNMDLNQIRRVYWHELYGSNYD